MTPRPDPAPAHKAEARKAEAGVTLAEVLVALALFAVIGAAGFSVLDQALRVQTRTEGRLARLAEVQRAMHVVKLDLMQALPGSVSLIDGAVSFRRGAATGDISVRYALEETDLVRRVTGEAGAARARQRLLAEVEAIRWSFLDDGGAWIQVWPPAETPAPADPTAVALDLALTGDALAGGLRRIAGLVERADP